MLVEGEIDAAALTHAATLSGVANLRFLPLPSLDPAEKGGGKDQLIKYLRGNTKLIANRQKSAPLVVLFDWDVADNKIAQAREAYGTGGRSFVVRMDEALCAPELGKTFRGIERFYPPRLVREAHEADELIVGFKTGKPYSVAADELSRGKRRLLERLLAVDGLLELGPLVQTVVGIDNAGRGPSTPQLTLPDMGQA